jgi:hypothetical protein
VVSLINDISKAAFVKLLVADGSWTMPVPVPVNTYMIGKATAGLATAKASATIAAGANIDSLAILCEWAISPPKLPKEPPKTPLAQVSARPGHDVGPRMVQLLDQVPNWLRKAVLAS